MPGTGLQMKLQSNEGNHDAVRALRAPKQRRRDMTAKSYSFEEFKHTFRLTGGEAERIYRITGPATADIDAFMRVRGQRARAEDWILDVHATPPTPSS
jgi:hypothetical protein